MTKTNLELAQWAISKVGCGYVYGAKGQVITEALIMQFASWNPGQYDAEYIVDSRYWIGEESYDCSGLVDTFIGGVDFKADGYYNMATVRGTIDSFPKMIGMLLHYPGHVGIYIGDGKVVEARGVDYGVVVTNLTERKWVFWSKCPLLTYITEVTVILEEPIFQGTPAKALTESRPTGIIKLGSKGSQVVWLQNRLEGFGFDVGVIDGIFGARTKTMVIAFQKSRKLVADGIVGEKTVVALEQPVKLYTNPYQRPSDASILKYLSRGEGVKWVQYVLEHIGYELGAIDGVFGTQTKIAVIDFQRKQGLVADGIVGARTLRKLDEFNK